MQRITVVLEYDDLLKIPLFHARMTAEISGTFGRIIAVALEDALSEKEDVCSESQS